MRCRECGKPLDKNSRFCANCDCDNYPQMYQVRTKTGYKTNPNQSRPASESRPTGQGNAYAYRRHDAEPKKAETPKSSGTGCLAIIIIVAVIWFICFLTINILIT